MGFKVYITPKKKIKANSFDEYRHKNSQQNFSQRTQQHIKKDHIPGPSGIHPKFTRMVQLMQINQCHNVVCFVFVYLSLSPGCYNDADRPFFQLTKF